jgi:hypothetical protein
MDEGIVFTQPRTMGGHEHLMRSEGPRHLVIPDPGRFRAGGARQGWNCIFGQWLAICLSVSEPSGNCDASDGFIVIHQLV